MPRVLTKKRSTACSGGSTLRSTFVDQRHPEGSTAALFLDRARRLAHRLCATARTGDARYRPVEHVLFSVAEVAIVLF